MNTKRRNIAAFILVLSLFISGCGPGQLFGPTRFISITAGYRHTCALTSGGGVKCWGDNEHGQLGDGTHTNRAAPVDVSGLTSGIQPQSVGHNSWVLVLYLLPPLKKRRMTKAITGIPPTPDVPIFETCKGKNFS